MTDRKRRLLSALIIVIMVTLAGCVGPIDDPTGLLGGDDNDVSGEEPTDAVPSEANFVAQFDPVGLVEDPTTEEIGNYVSQEFAPTNQSFDNQVNQSFEDVNEQLETFLQEENLSVELSPDDFGQVVLFGDTEQLDQSAGAGAVPMTAAGADESESQTLQQSPETDLNDQYAGVILELDLSEEDLTELFNAASDQVPADADANLTQGEYNNLPMYTFESEGQEASLIILDEGLHVLGPTDVAQDAADTYVGDSEGVSQDIVPNSTENTYFSLGTSDVNETLTGVSDQVENIDEDPQLESVLLTYSTNGDDTIELDADLTLDSGTAPFQMELEIEDQLEQFRAENGSQQNPQFGFVEPVAGEDNFDVSSDGDTLTVSYQATTDEIKEFIDGLSEADLGLGPGAGPGTGPGAGPGTGSDFPLIDVSTNVTEVDGQKQVVVEVLENENVETLIVEDFSGEVSESFPDPQVGDVYTVDVPPNTNVDIRAQTESGTESSVEFLFVEG